jgi:colicin import membrane protein
MKKLVLLCFLFVFSNNFYAQETKTEKEPAKKETTKKKSGYDYDKDVTVKSTKKEATSKSTTTKETAKKETTKKKSGYDYDKDVTVKKEAAKKETKSKSGYDYDKKSNKSEVNKVDAKIKDEKYTKGTSSKKAPTLKESNEKAPKKADKVTGEYKGKKVYTGSRGGKYYINKNGNKTYIQD